ncbi:acyl carrier protein [Sphingobacterium faecium]|uniref:acyl carrier protein n=1 Tax=Sphingobacterium faecium TaxID=34087 RepID=UPI00320AA1C2
MKDTIARVKQILSEKLDISYNLEEITPDISLLEDGIGLDSISIVNLIVMIETEFKISFDEEDLSMDMFSNLNKLCEVIENKVNKRTHIS